LITPVAQVKPTILASCLLGFVAVAFAQDAVNYSGKWRAQVTPPSGKTYDAEAIPGCVDSTVRVTWVDDKTMKGTRGTQPLVLVRD